MTTPGPELVAVDLRALSPAQLDEQHTFRSEVAAEAMPGDPVPSRQLIEAWFATRPDYLEIVAWQARVDDALVGQMEATLSHTGENEHVMEVALDVLPGHRRQGIGRALLDRAVVVAEGAGRRSLLGPTTDRIPAGAAFAERIGARAAMDVHTNRLLLADVDRALVDRWIADGPGGAPGYSLVAIDGDTPADELPAVLAVVDVMNDSPHDDLDVEPEHMTADQWRQNEKAMHARGAEHWMVLARHDDSGTSWASPTSPGWRRCRRPCASWGRPCIPTIAATAWGSG